VFWVLDNGSAHRGARAVRRLQKAWSNLHPVFTPVHASRLNQITRTVGWGAAPRNR